MINKIFYNYIMDDIQLPPNNRALLNEIKYMINELAQDIKVIKDDVHYVKIINMNPTPVPESNNTRTETSSWWWS